MGRVLDTVDIKTMLLFEKITGAKLRDFCEIDGVAVFVVEEGQVGKAIGKGAENIRRISDLLKKPIRIIEYHSELGKFVQKAIHPSQAIVNIEGGVIELVPPNTKTRGYLIGKGGQNLRWLETLIKRYFPIQEIRVPKGN